MNSNDFTFADRWLHCLLLTNVGTFSYRDSFCFQHFVPHPCMGGHSHHRLKHTSPPWTAKIWGNNFLSRYIHTLHIKVFLLMLSQTLMQCNIHTLQVLPDYMAIPSSHAFFHESFLHILHVTSLKYYIDAIRTSLPINKLKSCVGHASYQLGFVKISPNMTLPNFPWMHDPLLQKMKIIELRGTQEQIFIRYLCSSPNIWKDQPTMWLVTPSYPTVCLVWVGLDEMIHHDHPTNISGMTPL